MHIEILTIGPLKKNNPLYHMVPWYIKRIKSKVTIKEIAPAEPSCPKEHVELWLHNIGQRPSWSLDASGHQWSDTKWAQTLEKQRIQGTKQLCITIGGTYGLPKEIVTSSQHVIGLSNITWNHLLMRALVLEIVFRSEKIWENHPYART